MSLNTSGRCDSCHGIVQNATGKRYTIEALTAIHDVSCPRRGAKIKVDLADAALDVKAAVTA